VPAVDRLVEQLVVERAGFGGADAERDLVVAEDEVVLELGGLLSAIDDVAAVVDEAQGTAGAE
jgi:hypothetical protein